MSKENGESTRLIIYCESGGWNFFVLVIRISDSVAILVGIEVHNHL